MGRWGADILQLAQQLTNSYNPSLTHPTHRGAHTQLLNIPPVHCHPSSHHGVTAESDSVPHGSHPGMLGFPNPGCWSCASPHLCPNQYFPAFYNLMSENQISCYQFVFFIKATHTCCLFISLDHFSDEFLFLLIYCSSWSFGASRIAQLVKNLLAILETWVQFLGWEDHLEKEMATHSHILAWKIPRTEEPGRLQSIGRKSRTRLSAIFLFEFLLPLILSRRSSCFCFAVLLFVF